MSKVVVYEGPEDESDPSTALTVQAGEERATFRINQPTTASAALQKAAKSVEGHKVSVREEKSDDEPVEPPEASDEG